MDEKPTLQRKHWYRLWGFRADSTADRPQHVETYVHILTEENSEGFCTARRLETGEEICIQFEHYGGTRWGARLQPVNGAGMPFQHFPYCEQKTRTEVAAYVDSKHLSVSNEEKDSLQRTITRWFRHLNSLRRRRH